ncbi:DUF3987 domain-containing protein [Flagellimonas hymeniacidonis]|uniref:DUF3987 domain-containing protein n=1 Tax=Flagellimonas hymeniacidonis TaxID=2603628 RepID=A0A5C8V5A5_9FLAO|nr:DUF3987 domain-containing protein [Flagellimonas hymeniacidonis]TXN36897.1 DUF3987 domain-containing protein [Flagellimonas hymeniacidonis]
MGAKKANRDGLIFQHFDLENFSKTIDNAMIHDVNGFPIDVFPDCIQKLIENARTTVLFNPDYFSAGILSTVATSMGSAYSLNNGSFSVMSILWLTIVGRRGTAKTHPLSKAKEPLENQDSKSYLNYREELKVSKSSTGIDDTRKPTFKKFLLDDFTIEKLVELLSFNERGVMIFQDELLKWVNEFDKYRGKGGDQQAYLKLWNGSIYSVDRKSSDAIRIENPCVNILGGMQTELLKTLATNRTSDGFLDRFLFVIPENPKPRLFTGERLDTALFENYCRIINNILGFEGHEIFVGPKCLDIYKSWQHKKAMEVDNDDLEHAIQSKMETYIWRLALVLETMHQASIASFKKELSEDVLHKTIRLVEYFRIQALKVHDKLATYDPIEKLNAIERELYEKMPVKFKRNDVLRIAEEHHMSNSSLDRFLKRKELFDNRKKDKTLSYGVYKKIYY